MANLNKNKGRRAERSAQEYLELIGWKVVDVHHNDAMEGKTNADLLAFPEGPIPADSEQAVASGLEVQVKYSSANSYGYQGIYNRHEAEEVPLGKYRSDPAEADFGACSALWWKKYARKRNRGYCSGGLNAMLENLHCPEGGVAAMQADTNKMIWVDNYMSKIVRGFADNCDLLMCRAPREPWLLVWSVWLPLS